MRWDQDEMKVREGFVSEMKGYQGGDDPCEFLLL